MPDEETMQSLPKVYQQIIEDVSNVKEYAKCWDVVIDSALVEPLEKETVILALGQETPEELSLIHIWNEMVMSIFLCTMY